MSSEDLVREAHDPATTPARLADLAAADSATWAGIAGNPAAYDGLLTWLGERGDASVDAALAARAQAALPPVPPAPPAPPAPPVSPVSPVEDTAPIETTAPIAPVDQAPEHTAVYPSFPAAEPAAATAAFGAVPPGGGTPLGNDTDGGGSGAGKPLGVVVAAVVVVIALIGGAAYAATEVFGGDDDSPSIGATGSPDTKTPDAGDEPGTAPSNDSEDDGSDSAASGDFCDAMKTLQEASYGGLSSSGSTPDLDDIKDLADDLADAYAEVEKSAPSELKKDVEAMSAYVDLLKDPTSADAQSLGDDMTDYVDAAQRVGVYYAKNCL